MTTRIACLGDSLTRAQFSVDYLDLLGRRHPPGDVQLARFGTNGDFTYNLLQRLNAVVTNPPDVITVLIGTNDARASLTGYPVEQAMKRKQLPERPSVDEHHDLDDDNDDPDRRDGDRYDHRAAGDLHRDHHGHGGVRSRFRARIAD